MKVLTATAFNAICARLWGENTWRPSAARALKKGVRTIERYSSGESNVPPTVRQRLAACTAIRLEELHEDYDLLTGQ